MPDHVAHQLAHQQLGGHGQFVQVPGGEPVSDAGSCPSGGPGVMGQVVGDDVGGGGAADAGDDQCGGVGGPLPVGYQGRDDVVAQSAEIASSVRRVDIEVRSAAHFFGQGPTRSRAWTSGAQVEQSAATVSAIACASHKKNHAEPISRSCWSVLPCAIDQDVTGEGADVDRDGPGGAELSAGQVTSGESAHRPCPDQCVRAEEWRFRWCTGCCESVGCRARQRGLCHMADHRAAPGRPLKRSAGRFRPGTIPPGPSRISRPARRHFRTHEGWGCQGLYWSDPVRRERAFQAVSAAGRDLLAGVPRSSWSCGVDSHAPIRPPPGKAWP